MKIAITGHRPNKLGNDYTYQGPLFKAIIKKLQGLIEEYQPTEIISGMALGIDTVWAVLALKNKIPLLAAIPCTEMYSKWVESSARTYHRIVRDPLCTPHFVSEEPYTPYCMQKRNEFMVDRCNLLIAVWDGTAGGTANCVKYAKKVGRNIIYIDPKELTNEK